MLLPHDPKNKAGNMSSWLGPTWISVRCRGKSEWRSSPVGSAPTQRRAQMRPPAPATPKHPCQVKTTPSDPQTDRQAASMPAIMHGQSGAQQRQPTFLSAFRDLILSERSTFVQSFNFGLQSLCPLPQVGTCPIYPPATCPDRSTGINCPTSS